MLGTFLKNTQIQNYMKINPAGAESFHAGGRATVVAFCGMLTRLKDVCDIIYRG